MHFVEPKEGEVKRNNCSLLFPWQQIVPDTYTVKAGSNLVVDGEEVDDGQDGVDNEW